MKGLISALITTCFLVAGAAPLAQAGECTHGKKTGVKKGHKNWKIAGMLFGTHDGSESTNPSFFIGGGLPKEPVNHRPIKVKLDLSRNPDLVRKLNNEFKDQPVALHYGISYGDYWGGFHDTFKILDAHYIYEYFEHSPSNNREFNENCNVKRGKKEPNKTMTGYVLAVERKGLTSLTRSCNVTVGTGGTQKENRREITGYKDKETCIYFDGDWFPTCTTESIPTYRYYQVDIPARYLLVAHSEEACRYAEDVGRTRAQVTFDYSISKGTSLKNPNATIIHKMTVHPKLQETPPMPAEPETPEEPDTSGEEPDVSSDEP